MLSNLLGLRFWSVAFAERILLQSKDGIRITALAFDRLLGTRLLPDVEMDPRRPSFAFIGYSTNLTAMWRMKALQAFNTSAALCSSQSAST